MKPVPPKVGLGEEEEEGSETALRGTAGPVFMGETRWVYLQKAQLSGSAAGG